MSKILKTPLGRCIKAGAAAGAVVGLIGGPIGAAIGGFIGGTIGVIVGLLLSHFSAAPDYRKLLIWCVLLLSLLIIIMKKFENYCDLIMFLDL